MHSGNYPCFSGATLTGQLVQGTPQVWRSVVLHPEVAFFDLPASAPRGSPEVLESDAVLPDQKGAILIFRFPGPLDSIRPSRLHEYNTSPFFNWQAIFCFFFHREVWIKWENLTATTSLCRHGITDSVLTLPSLSGHRSTRTIHTHFLRNMVGYPILATPAANASLMWKTMLRTSSTLGTFTKSEQRTRTSSSGGLSVGLRGQITRRRVNGSDRRPC